MGVLIGRSLKSGIVMAMILALTGPRAVAEIVVNEVMANEPGRATLLEWIELYNDSSASTSLADYELGVGEERFVLPDTVSLAAGEYLVLCRRLTSSSTASFEGHWGDSSGVWGDCEEELGLLTPLEIDFALVNSGSAVGLDHAGILVSELAWTTSGADGVSWERVAPSSGEVLPSSNPEGSTPGRINSLTPREHDLALVKAMSEPLAGGCRVVVTVLNVGQRSAGGWVTLALADDPTESVDDLVLPEIAPGDSAVVSGDLVLPGVYLEPLAALCPDDRAANDTLEFIATGADFPPLIVTEFLPDPAAGLGAEWVEIANTSHEDVALLGWRVGDERDTHAAIDSHAVIAPGERAILCDDHALFATRYPDVSVAIVPVSPWAQLNNAGDVVRLVDPHGFSADSVAYATACGDGRSWCRGEEPEAANRWGCSVEDGGSPGAANRVMLTHEGSGLNVTATPRVFSPDGDGFEDECIIHVASPKDGDVRLRIYDREGRQVRAFAARESMGNYFVWDGRGDGGERLPIGIYIAHYEVSGVGSDKIPVVIAQ